MSKLTFDDLRRANIARLPTFKNRKGLPAHSEPDGSDWSLNDWCTAITGELGEAADILKKVRRGDFSLEEGRPDLAKELADVQTYLDILAFRAGIDLGQATIDKFNKVSERVGSPVQLNPNGKTGREEHLEERVEDLTLVLTQLRACVLAERREYGLGGDESESDAWEIALERVADVLGEP